MFRLAVCCLALSAVLAKPAEKAPADAAAKWDNHGTFLKSGKVHSEPTTIEVDSGSLSGDPKPLPPPTTSIQETDGTGNPQQTIYFILYPGVYVFNSPSYPNNYPNNGFFHYVFRGYSFQELSVVCNPFSVQYHPHCDYDWLSFNGSRFCGSSTVTYRAVTLDAKFLSNGQDTDRGFQCEITVPKV